jgi:hypothetical protein
MARFSHSQCVSEDLLVKFAEERRRKSLRRRASGSHSYRNISIGFHMETQPKITKLSWTNRVIGRWVTW